MPAAKTPSSATMVLVALRWNGEPFAARAVKPGESVMLGDAKDALAPLPQGVLGHPTLAVADTQDGPHAIVPDGKVASITDRRGRVRLVSGPERVALSQGEEASLLFGAFEVTIGAESPEPSPKRRRPAAGAWAHTAVVAAIHAALLVAGSRAALASSIEEDTTANLDQLRAYLAAAEERSGAPDAMQFSLGGKADTAKVNGHHGNGKNAGGERHAGESGKAGVSTSRAKNKHFGAPEAPEKGTAATAESELAAAREFGMVSMLNTVAPMANTGWAMAGASAWSGADPLAAAGGLFGRTTGESEGAAGLALSGIGEGGGGRGAGIGLGLIGTIGHGDGLPGLGTGGNGSAASGGTGQGFSTGWGRLGGSHRSHVITCRFGDPTMVSGRLPPEAVQRVIRSNFGRFRGCYQDGLFRNPALAGRVTTRFIISLDGSVAAVADGGTDLPDASVGACVRKAFMGLSFPQPEGGTVTVTYPLMFSPE